MESQTMQSGRYVIDNPEGHTTRVQVICPPQCNQFFVLVEHSIPTTGGLHRLIIKKPRHLDNSKYEDFYKDLLARGAQVKSIAS